MKKNFENVSIVLKEGVDGTGRVWTINNAKTDAKGQLLSSYPAHYDDHGNANNTTKIVVKVPGFEPRTFDRIIELLSVTNGCYQLPLGQKLVPTDKSLELEKASTTNIRNVEKTSPIPTPVTKVSAAVTSLPITGPLAGLVSVGVLTATGAFVGRRYDLKKRLKRAWSNITVK